MDEASDLRARLQEEIQKRERIEEENRQLKRQVESLRLDKELAKQMLAG